MENEIKALSVMFGVDEITVEEMLISVSSILKEKLGHGGVASFEQVDLECAVIDSLNKKRKMVDALLNGGDYKLDKFSYAVFKEILK